MEESRILPPCADSARYINRMGIDQNQKKIGSRKAINEKSYLKGASSWGAPSAIGILTLF